MKKKDKHIDVYELIAKNIKYYRKSRNMTQAELAEKTEYSHEFIRRIDAVSNIANALDIDIELLFEKREDNEEK